MSSIAGVLNKVVVAASPTQAGAARSEKGFLVHPLITALTVEQQSFSAGFVNPVAGAHVTVLAGASGAAAPSLGPDQSDAGNGATSLFGGPSALADLTGFDASATLAAGPAAFSQALADDSTAGAVRLGYTSPLAATGAGTLAASLTGAGASADAPANETATLTLHASGATVTFASTEGLPRVHDGGQHHGS